MSVSSRRTFAAVLGSLLAVGLLILGVWVIADGDDSPPTTPAAPAPSGTPTPGQPPTTPAEPTGTPAPAATIPVKVYFHSGEDQVVAVTRRVPSTPKVATAALTQLLAGPTAAEREDGITSWFSSRTAGMLRSVRVADGVAYADFGDLRRVIPNASTSAGSTALLAELDATLEQFSTVRRTVYSIRGDVSAFYEWLQLAPPPSRPEVLQVVTMPRLRDVDGWWQLPGHAGMVWFTATVRGADRVAFYLVPTGTNTWPQRRLLPHDAYAGHPHTARLDYRDEPLSGHVVVVASGPGGEVQHVAHNVHHP